MFRLKLPQSHLNVWKREMLGGKKIPSWIGIEPDEKKREEMINALTTDDIFYNHFRAGLNDEPVLTHFATVLKEIR